MKKTWARIGGVSGAVVMALLGAPVHADDQSGMTTVAAEELDRRSKAPATEQGGGLSTSAVRVMVTYAFSLIPNQVKSEDGKVVPLDKSDPNKFLIPEDDARRVIRAATRSAYADVCGIPELGKANYNAMLAQEKAQGNWSQEQMVMIEALHLFSVSYFTGNAKFTRGTEEGKEGAEGAPAASAEGEVVEAAPPPPSCPPEQRQKVESAINAYVAATGAN